MTTTCRKRLQTTGALDTTTYETSVTTGTKTETHTTAPDTDLWNRTLTDGLGRTQLPVSR